MEQIQVCAIHNLTRAPRFSDTWSLMTFFAALVCSIELTISSVALWPLTRIWSYFIIPFDDFGEGLIDFVSTNLNLFSGAECPTSLDTSLEFSIAYGGKQSRTGQ
jgi:hypothetical protein